VRFACPRPCGLDTALHHSGVDSTISQCAWDRRISLQVSPFFEVTLHGESVCAILLDIEGTTTPLDFVYKALFPYTRSHVKQFLRRLFHLRKCSLTFPGFAKNTE